MDPLQAIGAAKAVGEAMGETAYAAMRFLAEVGWLLAGTMFVVSGLLLRALLKAERGAYTAALRMAVSGKGTNVVVAKLARRNAKKSAETKEGE